MLTAKGEQMLMLGPPHDLAVGDITSTNNKPPPLFCGQKVALAHLTDLPGRAEAHLCAR